jgi:HD-like signal output (HDOD) protein
VDEERDGVATMNDRTAEPRDRVLIHHTAIVDAAQRMRPLSHSTLTLVELCARNNTDLAVFGKVIAHDQVLAATVLREANSAASAASEPISSIEQALVRLGLGRVLTVAIQASVFDQIDVAVPEYGLAQGDLALDSVVGSIAAEIVRERAHVRLPSALPTAALVRNIGLLVLANLLDGPDGDLLGLARENGLSLPASERMALDADHAEVGAVLCQAWRFSDTVRLGVQYHHDPAACCEPMAWGLYVADAIAHRISEHSRRSWSHSVAEPETLAAAMDAIGIPLAQFDPLVDNTITRFLSRDTSLVLDLELPEAPPSNAS